MPLTVVFLKDHGEHKKGDRARVVGPAFFRLRKQGKVERVVTTPEDLKLPVETLNVITRGTNPNSLKNLKKTGNKVEKPKKKK